MTLAHGRTVAGEIVPFLVLADGTPANVGTPFASGLTPKLLASALSAIMLLQDSTPSPANQAIINDLNAVI